MDGLRWLLLMFGLLVIAGVYLYSRKEKMSADNEEGAVRRVEPRLDAPDADSGEDSCSSPELSIVGERSARDESDPTLPDEAQKIVTIRLVAREKKSFPGDDLILNMRGIGLRHGKFGIFHRYDGNDESKTIFSAASLVEPGSFDLQNITLQEIPGISLFLIMPGPVDGVEAFDLMMAAARALAQSLDGELLDESGSSLSIQRERYLREEIIQFQHITLLS